MLKSKAFARSVELDLEKADCRFSDNYFDLPGSYIKRVTIEKSNLPEKISLNEIKRQLKIRSLYDIEER